MDIQRIRNLTTHRLHTKMEDIYRDIEFIVGEEGIMTHMLPNAVGAMTPYLKEQITDPRFWDDQFDPTHVGEVELLPMTLRDQQEFWKRYGELPSPFANFGKD